MIRPGEEGGEPEGSRPDTGTVSTTVSGNGTNPTERSRGDRKSKKFRRYGEWEDRRRRRRARVYSVLGILSGLGYLALLPGSLSWEHPFVAGSFLVAEIVCLALFALAAGNVWQLRFKPESGLPVEGLHSVDVFITVCGEPFAVVDRALSSAASLEWDGPLNVYVLDDGASPEVERRARELGLNYESRLREGLERTHRKAGNLNFGLERSDGEMIFTLDADHEVDPEALKALAGYHRISDVAFVQSKQSFVVPTGDPFNSDDPVFYDAVQLANDADDTTISCGSGVLYRREALEDIGGFAEWNLVEDLTTSYELHSKGWKGLYFPFSVTRGLAPANILEVTRQRLQWAIDTMRIFFWDNPLFKKRLSWNSRLNHLMIGSSYIWAGFFMPVFLAIPLWGYLTGESLLVENEVAIVLVRIVYFLLFAVAAQYLFRGKSPGKQYQFLVGLFPVYFWGALRALFLPPGKELEYRVNNVGSRDPSMGRLWLTLSPQLAFLAANALLPFYAIARGIGTPWLLAGNIVVSAFVLWTLFPVVNHGLTYRSDAVSRVVSEVEANPPVASGVEG